MISAVAVTTVNEVTHGAAGSRHTAPQLWRMSDLARGTHYELIDSVAYAVAPAPTRVYQRLVVELSRQIGDALEGAPCQVNVAPFDVRLLKANEADEDISTVVEADIVVVCDAAKLDARGCRGAPDLVIEALLPATAAHDQAI